MEGNLGIGIAVRVELQLVLASGSNIAACLGASGCTFMMRIDLAGCCGI